jgi:RNA polymerase sigma-70 factor (ECF subfamily)
MATKERSLVAIAPEEGDRTPMSDNGPRDWRELLMRAKENRKLFYQFVEAAERDVFRYVWYLAGGSIQQGEINTVVEDAVQNIFLNIFRALPNFNPDNSENSVRAWVIRIAHNTLFGGLRTEFRYWAMHKSLQVPIKAEDSDEDSVEPVDPKAVAPSARLDEAEDAEQAKKEKERLPTLLDRLEPVEREIILLRFFGELTALEIIDLLNLGITESSFSLRVKRILAKLRRLDRGDESNGTGG